jgi:hypothetical protein
MHLLLICLNVFSLFYLTEAVSRLEIHSGLQCSYNYDLEVHTHRGERSTKEVNFKINAKVCFEGIFMTYNASS